LTSTFYSVNGGGSANLPLASEELQPGNVGHGIIRHYDKKPESGSNIGHGKN
jgi:hypothetical protein